MFEKLHNFKVPKLEALDLGSLFSRANSL